MARTTTTSGGRRRRQQLLLLVVVSLATISVGAKKDDVTPPPAAAAAPFAVAAAADSSSDGATIPQSSPTNNATGYQHLNWADLPVSIRNAYATLGYTPEIWDDVTGSLQPDSHSLDWNELSEVERDAALFVGYTEESWRAASSPTVAPAPVASAAPVTALAAFAVQGAEELVSSVPAEEVSAAVENCYVLSLNMQACDAASNCEWNVDPSGGTVCSPGLATTTTNATTTVPTSADCDGDEMTEELCGASPAKCVWDENGCRRAETPAPSLGPSMRPTARPTDVPTEQPVTPSPTTDEPTTAEPTAEPTTEPTRSPTPEPTAEPTLAPTPSPTTSPSRSPTTSPTSSPTSIPTTQPTDEALVDCKSPSISTDECANAPACLWDEDVCRFASAIAAAIYENRASRAACYDYEDKDECRDSSYCSWEGKEGCAAAPTDPPSGSPTLAVCPEMKKEKDCAKAAHCEWDGTACELITVSPTVSPSGDPTNGPTKVPTISPTGRPSVYQESPSSVPSSAPSKGPTGPPTPPPTISIAPTVRASSSPSESYSPTSSPMPTPSPSVSHFPTVGGYEYVRPDRNDVRYVPWNELGRDLREAAAGELRYTRETWNAMGTASVERLRWDDLSEGQRGAARILGFEDDVSWNCWQNNWESFSWKQLYTLKLTPYLTSLGWDQRSWNDQYRDAPMPRYDAWDYLTDDQRRAADQLCYYKTSYDRLDLEEYGYGYPVPKPSARFRPWRDVSDAERVRLERSFGYTELTWNVLRLSDAEQKGWFELMYYEEDVSEAVLGLDGDGWDCWINHYDSYGWSDLVKKGHVQAMSGLGWTEDAWNGDAAPPASDSKMWHELTEAEQLHATRLCFFDDNWNREDMTPNDGPFPFSKPKLRYTAWSGLSPEDRKVAQNMLLYDEQTWNYVGSADIEKRAWDDLTEYQRPYAIQLGLYQRTWDCFQNHYRATKWNGLSDDVLDAASVLGWDEGRWSRWASEPTSYEKRWSELGDKEQAAAHVLCHFDVNWPGGGSTISLENLPDVSSGADHVEMYRVSSAVLAVIVTTFFLQWM